MNLTFEQANFIEAEYDDFKRDESEDCFLRYVQKAYDFHVFERLGFKTMHQVRQGVNEFLKYYQETNKRISLCLKKATK